MMLLPLNEGPPAGPGRLRYALLAVGVALLGLAGYVGYVTYPRFHLPSVTGAALMALAAGAGAAAFFSPCSFSLLLTLLAREARSEGSARRTEKVASFAAAFSLGIVGFLAVLGGLIAFGGRGLASAVTFLSPTGIAIRITVGSLLVLLGLIQAEIIPGSFHGVTRLTRPLQDRLARFRRRSPIAGAMLFGFVYLLIAI